MPDTPPFETGYLLNRPGTDRYLELEGVLLMFSSERVAREYCEWHRVLMVLGGVRANCMDIVRQAGAVHFIS